MKKLTFQDQALVNIERLVELVLEEHLRQMQKWGIQERTPPEWIMYLAEEVGEVAEAGADLYYGRTKESSPLVLEALHVATLALKIAEMAAVHGELRGFFSLERDLQERSNRSHSVRRSKKASPSKD